MGRSEEATKEAEQLSHDAALRARVWTVGRTSGGGVMTHEVRWITCERGNDGAAGAAAAAKQHRVDFLQFGKRHPSFARTLHPENLDMNMNTRLPHDVISISITDCRPPARPITVYIISQ